MTSEVMRKYMPSLVTYQTRFQSRKKKRIVKDMKMKFRQEKKMKFREKKKMKILEE